MFKRTAVVCNGFFTPCAFFHAPDLWRRPLRERPCVELEGALKHAYTVRGKVRIPGRGEDEQDHKTAYLVNISYRCNWCRVQGMPLRSLRATGPNHRIPLALSFTGQ